MLFPEVRKRARKVGQPPGTAVYTGKKNDIKPSVHVTQFSTQTIRETSADNFAACITEISTEEKDTVTWVNVTGLSNISLIEEIATHYKIHPLTIEDILNVQQRPKVEEFENYEFITLKALSWDDKKHTFSIEQISFVFGNGFLLSFQEKEYTLFNQINERLRSGPTQRLRQQGSDYLTYRLLDIIVDNYFVALEGVGDQLEDIEELIISSPRPQNTRTIYKLKRQVLLLRKAIWPVREVVSHLLQVEGVITHFTRIYLRDLYDHVVQAVDTTETFRDMLSSMLDMYISGLTNRMNEVMKTLTIIATIFIPITFIASVYGMNFDYMPELHWHYGYMITLGLMVLVAIGMLIYFWRQKWI